MSILECHHCYEGPCYMVESIAVDGWWPSSCMRGLNDEYVEWTRVKSKMLVIRQPTAMKVEIQEFLTDCMNTGSGSKNLEIIQIVAEIIDQYVAEVDVK